MSFFTSLRAGLAKFIAPTVKAAPTVAASIVTITNIAADLEAIREGHFDRAADLLGQAETLKNEASALHDEASHATHIIGNLKALVSRPIAPSEVATTI